jgi:hypothetical protein
LNSFTARPKPGTQAQKVIFVALEDLHELPAMRVVPLLGLAAALDEVPEAAGVDDPLLPQPASTAMAVAPISSVAPRLARKPGPDEWPRCLVSANISAGLLACLRGAYLGWE